MKRHEPIPYEQDTYLLPEGDRKSYRLKEFVAILFKHKRRIAAIFFAVVLLVALISLMRTPVYEARSGLLIKIGREFLNSSELGAESRPVLAVNQEEVTNSEIQILTNRNLIKQVIAAVSLNKMYPELAKDPPKGRDPMEEAAFMFEKKLRVEAVKKSNVVWVSFRHEDPQIAAQAVNTLIDLFKEKHLEAYSTPRSSFLEQQLQTYEAKLKDSETKLQSFKQQKAVYQIEEQRTMLLQQRSDLDTVMKVSEHSIQELQKRVAHLKNQAKSMENNGIRYTASDRDNIIIEANNRLLNLKLTEQELSKKYKSDSYLVQNAREERQLVEEFIKKQETDTHAKVKTSNPVFQNVEMELVRAETELSSQKGKLAALRQQVKKLDSDIKSLDSHDQQLQELKRAQMIHAKNYETYAGKAEEARISEDMNRMKLANISVIQEATAPDRPLKRNRLLHMILATIAGGALGVGFAFFSEVTRQTFSSPKEVERRLGLPVLACIPHEEP